MLITIKGLINTSVILLAVGAGIAPAVAASPDEQNRSAQETARKPQTLAQSKAKVPAPSPAAEHAPSNIDLLNKALKPGASDPDVPLPHPDLARPASEQPASLSGPQFFARQEQGGGVFGLKMPIAVK
jgi:hypothetical protein